MITLGIETSCDETSIALLETVADNSDENSDIKYRVLSHTTFSQIDIHAVYGGVFPIIAKREHAKRLVPLLEHSIKESKIETTSIDADQKIVHDILSEKEADLLEIFLNSGLMKQKPAIDRIAVTVGPGLEPALWVGVNFARTLGAIWNIPIVATNHMEGHIVGALLSESEVSSEFTTLIKPNFPILALLISGGHTELVSVESIGSYTILGKTKDDAVGEAFDKVARMMNIPYPGGPVISKYADEVRGRPNPFTLPRPMLHSPDMDFSFSGLKTSVLYLIEKLKKENNENHLTDNPEVVKQIALAFEDAVTEVLIVKTRKAIEKSGALTLIVGGGVIANTHIRESLTDLTMKVGVSILLPLVCISGDNALMIALAGAMKSEKEIATTSVAISSLEAVGNLSLQPKII